MQPFDFLCTHCHGTLRVSIPELVGRKVHCPHCRKPIVVVEPEGTGYAWGEQTAEAQVGSGLRFDTGRFDTGSGLALAPAPEGSAVLDQHHVWADDYPQEDDSVLGGEEPEAWKEDETERLDEDATATVEKEDVSDEVVDLLESALVDVAEPVTEEAVELAAVEPEAVEEAVVEEAPEASEEEDEPPSVDIAPPSRSSQRATYAGARGRKFDMPHPLLLVGGAIGAILMVVALSMAVSKSSGSSARAKGANGKVQRRNPQEFQDFARDAAKRGWR